MMDNRGVTWKCSRCDATFSTREDLAAHAAAHDRSSANTPSDGIAMPSTPSEDLAGTETPSDRVASRNAPAQHVGDNAVEQTDAGHAVQAGQDATLLSADEKPATATRRLARGWWLALAVALAIAVGLVAAFPHQVAHQVSLAVTKHPEPFTELYFSNPRSLPKALSVSQPNPFGFTIVNHEGHDTAYSYIVTMTSARGSAVIARGKVDLRNNSTATRLVDVRPTSPGIKYSIAVGLVGRTETIWFTGVSK